MHSVYFCPQQEQVMGHRPTVNLSLVLGCPSLTVGVRHFSPPPLFKIFSSPYSHFTFDLKSRSIHSFNKFSIILRVSVSIFIRSSWQLQDIHLHIVLPDTEQSLVHDINTFRVSIFHFVRSNHFLQLSLIFGQTASGISSDRLVGIIKLRSVSLQLQQHFNLIP